MCKQNDREIQVESKIDGSVNNKNSLVLIPTISYIKEIPLNGVSVPNVTSWLQADHCKLKTRPNSCL